MALNIVIDADVLRNADTRTSNAIYFCDRLNWRRVSDCLALHTGSPSVLLQDEKVSNCQTCILTATKDAMSMIKQVRGYHL